MKHLLSLFLAALLLYISVNPALAADGSTTVYVTKSGECYHSGSCSYLRSSKIAITLQSATDQGYRPCSRCSPPVLTVSSAASPVNPFQSTAEVPYIPPSSSQPSDKSVSSTYSSDSSGTSDTTRALTYSTDRSSASSARSAVSRNYTPLLVLFGFVVVACFIIVPRRRAATAQPVHSAVISTPASHAVPADYVQSCTDAAFTEVFRGKPNPYTDMPITSEADYWDYISTYRSLHGCDPALGRRSEAVAYIQRMKAACQQDGVTVKRLHSAGVDNLLHTEAVKQLPF